MASLAAGDGSSSNAEACPISPEVEGKAQDLAGNEVASSSSSSGGGSASPDAQLPTPIFSHPKYELKEGDKITRLSDAPAPTSRAEHIEEEKSVLAEMVRYVTASMLSFGFKEVWIPEESATARCPIYCSQGWETAPRLLVILTNQVGGQAGLWSRSLCFSHGLKAGSMLPCVTRALEEGYGVLVLNPNLNSVTVSADYVDPREAVLTAQAAAAAANGEPSANGSVLPPPEEAAAAAANAAAASAAAVSNAHGGPNLIVQADGTRKLAIEGSRSPEAHVLGVWNGLICPRRAAMATEKGEVYLLSYGNGAALAKDIILKNLSSETEPQQIMAVAMVEASPGVKESDDTFDVKSLVASRVVNWEQHESAPCGARLLAAQPAAADAKGASAPQSSGFGKLGCVALSVGAQSSEEMHTAAWSVQHALDPAFRFFKFVQGQQGQEAPKKDAENKAAATEAAAAAAAASTPPSLGLLFAAAEQERLQLDPASATWAIDAVGTPEAAAAGTENLVTSPEKSDGSKASGDASGGGGISGMFKRMMSGLTGTVSEHSMDQRMKVSDFDLLKVVGKGAFGKVMLVRKKAGKEKGMIFAMKVLKKSMVISKGQVEHTNSERSILREIRHPYIVCLRYAFQNEEKLYLITDYYSGGSLFYHLRKARGFSENRTKFYGAQLLLALQHLHENHIIYRDLKLENVLMDHDGHIALTDFGLSKEGVEDVYEMQLSTFCGTAEYIAPELLKGLKYGATVDWWSLGVLLYEMMGFKTPFYDKNRKLMFYNIINNEPQWPPHFSAPAIGIIRGLLAKAPQRRLGSGVEGVQEIRAQPFFGTIDWDAMMAKEVEPPFKPEIKNILDPKFVPRTYLNEHAADSFDRNAKPNTNIDFDNFTYQPASALEGE